jgi:hypothetical protein
MRFHSFVKKVVMFHPFFSLLISYYIVKLNYTIQYNCTALNINSFPEKIASCLFGKKPTNSYFARGVEELVANFWLMM